MATLPPTIAEFAGITMRVVIPPQPVSLSWRMERARAAAAARVVNREAGIDPLQTVREIAQQVRGDIALADRIAHAMATARFPSLVPIAPSIKTAQLAAIDATRGHHPRATLLAEIIERAPDTEVSQTRPPGPSAQIALRIDTPTYELLTVRADPHSVGWLTARLVDARFG